MPRTLRRSDRFARPNRAKEIRASTPSLVPVAAGLLLLALVGCTPTPAAAPDSRASAVPTPTPTPTVEPVVVGPAEMPPIVFDGDCAAALTPEDIAEVTGRDLALDPPIQYEPSIDNAGGLRCPWSNADGAGIYIGIMPRAGLDGAEIPADLTERYFTECDGWVCSWQGGNDDVWVAISFNFLDEMTREGVDEWGDDLGQRIIARFADSAPEPWIRDRSSWWPAFECATIAEAVGAQLGTTLIGSDYGFEHLPAPEQLMGSLSSREAACILKDEGGALSLLVSTEAGQGGSFFRDENSRPAAPLDLGVPGIEAQTVGGELVVLIDGVNRADVFVYESAVPSDDIAAAVAAAAASDFQP